ncbi:MAG TPA: HAD hydrolase-like protein [Gemmatimonadaceae bacterium]|jgi:phosphoglycolate phosphatase|nr:HAD hydrolase-like protein [Gemmatimonadaceae bacterium]
MKTLVLFDIDGTILKSGGAGRLAMEQALLETFGMSGDPSYHYDGKTDRQIVRELLQGAGYDDAEIDAKMPVVLQRYLDALHDTFSSGARAVTIYDGVESLIDAVEARPDTVLGLLTGNILPGAHLKLGAAGLDTKRFVVNAFGSDHEVRAELPAIAHRRMHETFGVVLAGRDVVVIGDTPADISCGRALGARAIAVATGRYSVEDLRAHHPFAVFETLADTSAVLDAIGTSG